MNDKLNSNVLIAPPTTITLFLTALTGKRFSAVVERNASVGHVKELVQKEWGIPIDAQRLIFKGVQLNEGTIDQFHIDDESTITIVERLRGC